MKLFFTKKLDKAELATAIYDTIKDTKEVADSIDSDTDLTQPDTAEAMGSVVWEALKETGIWDSYKTFEVSTDNVSASSKDFGDADFVGFHTLDNGLTFMGFCMGGDGEIPLYVAVFSDGVDVMAAIPIDGNPYNTKTGKAYGNDALADAENMTLRIMQEQFKDLTVENMPVSADETEDAMIDLAGELTDIIRPRVDLMVKELERDILYYDVQAEEGQQIELPDPNDLKLLVAGGGLGTDLVADINDRIDKAVAAGEPWDLDGALVCSKDAVEDWVKAEGLRKCTKKSTEEEKTAEQKEVSKATRDHFREKLPDDFPLPVIDEDREILFKPGGRQAGDQEGEDLGDTTLRQEVEKFKQGNDVQRMLSLHRLQMEIASMTRLAAACSSANVEILMEEAKAKEAAAKKEKADVEEAKAGTEEPESK